MPGKRRAPMTLRFPEELEQRVRAEATRRDLPVNRLVVELIEVGLGPAGVFTQRAGEEERPVARAGPGRPVKKRKARTEICEHRRRPGEFCSRCD